MEKRWSKKELIRFCSEDHLTPFFDFMQDFDATLDNPWYILYEALDIQYPDSKFILTERNPEKWIQSCAGFFGDRHNPIWELIYGVDQFDRK